MLTVDTSQTVFSKCHLCRKRRNYLLWYMSPFKNGENAIVNNIQDNTWSPRGKGKMEYSTKFVQGNDVKYFIRLFFEHSFEKLTFNSKKLNTSKICKSKHRTRRDYGVNNKTLNANRYQFIANQESAEKNPKYGFYSSLVIWFTLICFYTKSDNLIYQ